MQLPWEVWWYIVNECGLTVNDCLALRGTARDFYDLINDTRWVWLAVHERLLPRRVQHGVSSHRLDERGGTWEHRRKVARGEGHPCSLTAHYWPHTLEIVRKRKTRPSDDTNELRTWCIDEARRVALKRRTRQEKDDDWLNERYRAHKRLCDSLCRSPWLYLEVRAVASTSGASRYASQRRRFGSWFARMNPSTSSS